MEATVDKLLFTADKWRITVDILRFTGDKSPITVDTLIGEVLYCSSIRYVTDYRSSLFQKIVLPHRKSSFSPHKTTQNDNFKGLGKTFVSGI